MICLDWVVDAPKKIKHVMCQSCELDQFQHVRTSINECRWNTSHQHLTEHSYQPTKYIRPSLIHRLFVIICRCGRPAHITNIRHLKGPFDVSFYVCLWCSTLLTIMCATGYARFSFHPHIQNTLYMLLHMVKGRVRGSSPRQDGALTHIGLHPSRGEE